MLDELRVLESRFDGLMMTNPIRAAFIGILNLAHQKYNLNVVETTSCSQSTYNQWHDQKEWAWSVSTTDWKQYIFTVRMDGTYFRTHTWWEPIVFFKTVTNGQDGEEIPLRAMTYLIRQLTKDPTGMENYLNMTALIFAFCCTRGNNDYDGCIAAIRSFGLENDLDALRQLL